MKRLFCTAQVCSLLKALALNMPLSFGSWGILVPGIKERMWCSLNLRFARRLLLEINSEWYS